MSYPTRRHFVKHSIFGTMAVATSHSLLQGTIGPPSKDDLYYRYPALDDEQVSGIVGASHGNFDKVKQLLGKRPELANAAWDWGFGDWETAIGAASHMGRKDIALYLIEHGARPDIFTYAMLGMLSPVKAMIEATPGVQSRRGPHGITLLQHAKSALRRKDISEEDRNNSNSVIQYLESLGDADIKSKSLEMTDDEKQMYLGNYRFGEGEDQIFEIQLNRREMLSIARKGEFGKGLNKTAPHTFTVESAPSVTIIFNIENNTAQSLTIHEPEPLVSATRI